MAKQKKTTSNSKGSDNSNVLPKLNRVAGQVGGIKKMIEDQRYCPEIIQQVRATRKALASIEAALIESHMRCCVQKTFEGESQKAKDEKLDEVIRLFKSSVSTGVEP